MEINTQDVNQCLLSITVAIDDNSQKFFQELTEVIKTEYPEVELNSFHEGLLKERKKAFAFKGGYSARKTPFAVLFDVDRNPRKAFYTEVEECTVENIKSHLDWYINQIKQDENESTSN